MLEKEQEASQVLWVKGEAWTLYRARRTAPCLGRSEMSDSSPANGEGKDPEIELFVKVGETFFSQLQMFTVSRVPLYFSTEFLPFPSPFLFAFPPAVGFSLCCSSAISSLECQASHSGFLSEFTLRKENSA